MIGAASDAAGAGPRSAAATPPAWLIAATAAMAAILLGLSVAETSFKGHYLIDQGEYVSLLGLVFILGAGIRLHRNGRLAASLPLVVPWLIYPVITQGDQIIDHLSINWMRAITHLLLGAIFVTPVAVITLAARAALAPAPGRVRLSPSLAWCPGLLPLAQGRTREGACLLAAALMTLEMWLAHQYLGALMIATLIVMIVAVLIAASWPPRARHAGTRRQRSALVLLVAGVALSAGLYLGFKNRPGAYQGSPSFLMDPSQADAAYSFDRIAVPADAVELLPDTPAPLASALASYGESLERLQQGYYVLDRNYNYHFHNELFVRSTPLLPEYRRNGLARIAEARALRDGADQLARPARASMAAGSPLLALLDEARDYTAYAFGRAATLERMSAEFERTKAGLQHATHIYEGEGKMLSEHLATLLSKHRRALDAAAAQEFAASARRVYEAYADRIVGF